MDKELDILEPSETFLKAFNRGYDLQRLSPEILRVLDSANLPTELKEGIQAGAKEYRDSPIDTSKRYVDKDIWDKIRKDTRAPIKGKDQDKDRG